MSNTNLTVNLNKVSYAKLYYRNRGDNIHVDRHQDVPWCNGSVLVHPDSFAYPYLSEYPNETRYERANRLYLTETWIPVLKLSLSNNHTLTFEHDKALKLWKAWQSYIFNKGKKK